MRARSFLWLVLLPAALTNAQAQEFSGSFAATDGSGTVLSLRPGTKGAVTGTISGDGITLQLAGERDGGLVAGWATGAGGSLHFHAEFVGGELQFTLFAAGANGQPDHDRGQSAMFRRADAAAAPRAAPAPVGPVDGERDPALVGRWVKQDITNDPTMSLTTEQIMELRDDGYFAQYAGRAVASGSGFSAEAGGAAERDEGFWRSEDNIVYVKGNGIPNWVPCCRYYVEGDRLLITYQDGTREIWHRRR